jgi:hypothetical protein
MLDDSFGALGTSGAAGQQSGVAGGASGAGDDVTRILNGGGGASSASGNPDNGGSGSSAPPVGDGGRGGAGTPAAPNGEGGQPGAAGLGSSNGTTEIPWDGVDDPARCRFGAPEKLSGFELGSSSAWGPALQTDSLTLLLSSSAPGHEDLFETSRSGRGTSFGPAIALSNVNTDSDEGTPFLAYDALSVYFYSNRPGGAGGRDIYVATRSALTDPFANPERLANVNGYATDHLPRVSADGRTLVFTSTRLGGHGAADLWIATRTSPTLDFGAPAQLEGVNTLADDESGQLSADQLTLVFDSNRSGGLGDHDLWMATRSSADAPFDPAINLSGLNSSANEINVLMSDDGEELFFCSNRDNSTSHQIWRAARSCDF